MVIEEIHKVNVHETCSREIAWILKPKGLDVRINKIRLEGKPVGEECGRGYLFRVFFSCHGITEAFWQIMLTLQYIFSSVLQSAKVACCCPENGHDKKGEKSDNERPSKVSRPHRSSSTRVVCDRFYAVLVRMRSY